MNQLSDDCTVFLFINLISFVSLFTLHALGSREPHRTHVSLTNTHTQKGKTYTNTHHSTLQLTFYGSGGLWRFNALPSSGVLRRGLLTLAPFFPVGPIICFNEIKVEL